MNSTYSSRFRSKLTESTRDKKEKNSLKIPVNKTYKTLTRQDFNQNVSKYWSELRVKHPPVRRTNHVGFFYQDYYYIFGGRDINQRKMNDMYRIYLDINNPDIEWEKMDNYGDIPEPLADHRGELFNNNFYVFGGINQTEEALNTLYIYSIEDNNWEKKEFDKKKVIPRAGHSMSLVGNKLAIFGGFSSGEFYNSVIIYNILEESWDDTEKSECDNEILEEGANEQKIFVDVNLPRPEARINHSQVTIESHIVIYGGVNKDGKYFNDMWMFNILERNWKKVEINGERPKARQGHSAIIYENDQILIFGGKIGNIFEINEFWKFDFNTKRFTLIQGSLLQKDGFTQQIKPKIIIETSTNHNPYQTFYKLKKVQMKTEPKEASNFNKANAPNKNKDKKHQYEEIAMGDDNTRNIKNSLIYQIGQEDLNYINSLADNNKELKFQKIKEGEVPVPRDGHTTFIYQNKMFVFGGDRNKYPFNDIYFFDFEKEKKDEESGSNKTTIQKSEK